MGATQFGVSKNHVSEKMCLKLRMSSEWLTLLNDNSSLKLWQEMEKKSVKVLKCVIDIFGALGEYFEISRKLIIFTLFEEVQSINYANK